MQTVVLALATAGADKEWPKDLPAFTCSKLSAWQSPSGLTHGCPV